MTELEPKEIGLIIVGGGMIFYLMSTWVLYRSPSRIRSWLNDFWQRWHS